MDEVDEVMDEFAMPTFGGAGFDEGFGETVGDDDKQR